MANNMRARVELRGCVTHTGRGRKVKRGEPFFITNASDIAYYQAQTEYSVTILEVAKPKAKPKPKAPPPPPPPPEEDDEEEDDEEEDEDDDEIDEPEDDGPATPSYTKSDLAKMNKEAIADLANGDFGLSLDPDKVSKTKMIGAVLKAQIKALEEDD